MAKNIWELFGVDTWGEHSHYTREEWRDAVAAQDTQLGYWEWVERRIWEEGGQ